MYLPIPFEKTDRILICGSAILIRDRESGSATLVKILKDFPVFFSCEAPAKLPPVPVSPGLRRDAAGLRRRGPQKIY